MKNKFFGLALLVLVFYARTDAQNVHVSVGFQTFYDQLQPYGTWVNDPNYGYVWRYTPASGEFRPYSTNGHWVYTDDGWTWVSDYDWGWAPFHYGRWTYDNDLGWLWVPGNEWAPAWVTWGSYNDNFAWAPVGPGISISIGNSYRPPSNYWVVCPGNYFGRADWHDHAIRSTERVTIVNKVTIINNYRTAAAGRPGYFRGPDTRTVERYTKAPVHAVKIADAARPGSNRIQNNSVAFYRPHVNDDRKNAKPPVPSRPADAAQLKREHPNAGKPQDQHNIDPNHGKGTAVPAPPANRPGDAFKPREGVRAGQPNNPPQQQKPGEPQHTDPGHNKPQQQAPVPNTPSRPDNRRPENTPHNNLPANQPQRPVTTPVSPAPVDHATERRPESGKNLPQRPETSHPVQQPSPQNNRPVERPQQPAQPHPVQQQPQRTMPRPHPVQPAPKPVAPPHQQRPPEEHHEVKPPPHNN